MDKKQLERDISKLAEFSHYYEKGMRRLEYTGIAESDFVRAYDNRPSSELTDKEMDDEMVRDAIERCVSNVSEALHHLSDETLGMLEEETPDLDWRGLSKYRNYSGHDYPQVNFSLVWGILQELPPYNEAVRAVEAALRERMISGEYDHA